MSVPFFSILIPVYNTARSLPKCLDSVLSQSFSDFEVIVINDGSTDDSAAVMEKYADKIKVVNNEENSGLVTTRIHGMQAASGKYIINLDSDDYMRPGALRILYNHISDSKEKYDITEYGYVREPEDVKVIHEKDTADRLKKLLIHEYPPTVWNKCYSSQIVKKGLELMEEFYCVFSEDCYFSIVFNLCGATYDYIDDVLVHYVTLEGVTSQNAVSLGQLERSILSLENSYKRVSALVEKYAPDMKVHLEEYRMASVRFLKRLATGEVVPYDLQFSYLQLLDQHFNAGFVEELFQTSKKYQEYSGMGRKAKISLCFKQIWKVLFNK